MTAIKLLRKSKSKVVFTLFFSFVVFTIKAQIIHPGLINTRAELDMIRANVNGSAAHPMKTGYAELQKSNQSKLTYQPAPIATVVVKGSGTTPDESRFLNDAIAAYAHTLQWVASGNSQHSQKAIQIINAWSGTLKDIVPEAGSPGVQDKLEAAWYAPIWLASAEILRHYTINGVGSGWTAADITKFDNNMVGLFKKKADEWSGSQGCCPNQGISVAFSRISIAVFRSDQTYFNNAVNFFTGKMLTRAIAADGEVIELNRIAGGDCGHATYNIEGIFDIAEIAWHQGVNLYEYKVPGENFSRLPKGLEYYSKCVYGGGVQTSNVGFVSCSSNNAVSIEIAFNHYMNRIGGYSLPQTQAFLMGKARPSARGAGKFIPWDTFTHADLNKAGSNQAPTVTITSPSNNATFTSPASITINANANDSDGSISKVDFYNGNTLLGSDNISPYSFNWNNAGTGTYSITARATDNKGAVTTSSLVSVKVNAPANVAPTVSIASPSNNATFTAPASVTINANASDSDGSISKVDFYNGSTLLGTDNTSPYSFAWNNISAGTYSITARATDNSNAVTTSAVITIVVNTVSASSATIYKNCSYGGYAVTLAVGEYTTSQLTSLGVLNNDVSSVKVASGYTITLYDGDNFTGMSLILTSDYTCLTEKGFNDKTYSVRVQQGAVPNVAPVVSITSPSNNASLTAPASITINANASDSDGNISKVDFYNGSTLIGTDNTIPYSYSWVNVAAGTYTISAKATDDKGATATSTSVTVIVNAPPTNNCNGVPQYIENAGYVAGSIVQNAGAKFECKPWPYSGWCNGAAWAYAPGTGAYWTDAWIQVGSCSSARQSSITSSSGMNVYPNPSSGMITIEISSAVTNTEYRIINSVGTEILNGQFNHELDLSSLDKGIYTLEVSEDDQLWHQKVVIK